MGEIGLAEIMAHYDRHNDGHDRTEEEWDALRLQILADPQGGPRLRELEAWLSRGDCQVPDPAEQAYSDGESSGHADIIGIIREFEYPDDDTTTIGQL